MSQKNIFPTESIEFSAEYHQSENTVRSQTIYSSIVIIIIAVIFLLPHIYVDITVQADGLIRPKSEKTEIKPITSGIVTNIFVHESASVQAGDTILIMRNENIRSKIEFTDFRTLQTADFIHDLEILLDSSNSTPLKTAYYQQAQIEYNQKVIEIKNRINKARKEVNRNTSLFRKGVLPEKDYDDLKYNVQLIENELKAFSESIRNNRQSDLVQKRNEYKQLLSQLSQYKQEEANFVITAPVTGTIEQFSGIYIGSNLNAGQTVAVISPASDLIAELYVAPKDIGYLSCGNKANIQIHAFNYNDWGMLRGEIIEISNDYIVSNETAYFRVRCKLDKTYLQLKNGFKGYLKKGMTTRSRFIVTERSLWQLLFDDINNWMNPAMNKTGE